MSIPERRDLSGVYFRYHNPETGRFENRTFEDLPEAEQDRVMADRDGPWLRSLAKRLAHVLREVGDLTDVSKYQPEEDDQ